MSYPLEFYLVWGLLVGLGAEACRRCKRIWAMPSLAVYGTVGAWYLGEIFYSGLDELYWDFGRDWVHQSLRQVALFLVVYRILVHFLIRKDRDPNEDVDVASRLDPAGLQKFFAFLSLGWAVLFFVGLARTEWDLFGILWPPSRETKTIMFGHSGMGAGLDFLVATCNYIYILICASLGIVFALSRGYVRPLALLLIAISWPYYWLDRARNVMLALLMPAVFCYWFSTRGGWWRKVAVTGLIFGMVNLWFQGVMRFREDNENLGTILNLGADSESESKHLGLNMLSELCWMNALIDLGAYDPNWGQRYLAEVAQVVPRTIWANKPTIGIDYAIARGFGGTGTTDGPDNAAGVVATVATGMIGQGVANFGPLFGVLATALLMALWTRILAGLWLRRFELVRFLLFAVGCGLTFNMGRDITLLVLWPFVFGYIGVVLLEKFKPGSHRETKTAAAAAQT